MGTTASTALESRRWHIELYLVGGNVHARVHLDP